ncbi:hypothetical protein CVT24_007268 [Panaeolus cyanescens]|uniref:Uncharacterized protein n=1 Tax=Panaeolus cyanescens TaxID=181874 RepID=A0A409WZ31_9AGAR|nr:hypothetical protein CVT24_007268 [Panaeolus cyanescens]
MLLVLTHNIESSNLSAPKLKDNNQLALFQPIPIIELNPSSLPGSVESQQIMDALFAILYKSSTSFSTVTLVSLIDFTSRRYAVKIPPHICPKYQWHVAVSQLPRMSRHTIRMIRWAKMIYHHPEQYPRNLDSEEVERFWSLVRSQKTYWAKRNMRNGPMLRADPEAFSALSRL